MSFSSSEYAISIALIKRYNSSSFSINFPPRSWQPSSAFRLWKCKIQFWIRDLKLHCNAVIWVFFTQSERQIAECLILAKFFPGTSFSIPGLQDREIFKPICFVPCKVLAKNDYWDYLIITTASYIFIDLANSPIEAIFEVANLRKTDVT